MKKLLIDVGNTTIHCKVFNTKNEKYENEFIFLTKKVLEDENIFDVKVDYDEAIYSCVVSGVEKILMKKVRNAKSIHQFNAIQQDDFVYPTDQLGQDFITNFYANNLDNAIVVSLGTATTFMIIKNKKTVGAIIAPGIHVGFNGLVSEAVALNFDFMSEVKWEDNLDSLWTKEAINKGVVNGHWYMVKGIVEEIESKYKIDDVILTGGYAKMLKQNEYTVDDDLIFKGLKNISSK